MKILQQILNQFGYVDSEQLKELREAFPNMQLVIKWGGSPREQVAASQVAERIAEVEARNDDYVREVFISSTNFRKLKSVLLNVESTEWS
jgi:hypothetical protein